MKVIVVGSESVGADSHVVQEPIRSQRDPAFRIACHLGDGFDNGRTDDRFSTPDKMERLTDDRSIRIEQRGDHHIMLWRTKSIRISDVIKAAENFVGIQQPLTSARNFDGDFLCRHNSIRFFQQRDFDESCQRLGHFVDDMKMQAVQSFVRECYLSRLPCPFQKIVSGLGDARAIQNSPTRRRPQILEKPDQGPTIFAVTTAPFGESLSHHFTGHNAAQFQVTIHVRRTQRNRIDPVDLLQIMIANIVEVPSCTRIPGDTLFPGRMMDDRQRSAGDRIHHFWFRNVCEPQTFGGEFHIRLAQFGRRTQIGANAVKMTDSRIWMKRQERRRDGVEGTYSVPGMIFAHSSRQDRSANQVLLHCSRGIPSIAACCSTSLFPQ